MTNSWTRFTPASLLLFAAVFAACAEGQAPALTSYVSGTLTVSAAVDSVADYSGFEILIASNAEGDIDSLGFATTDTDGRFATVVRATERGVYPLIISRAGQTLTVEEIVIAEGDSTRVSARFPLEGRPVRIVSQENAAWSAYKNTKAQYNRMVLQLVQSEAGYTEPDMRRVIMQTAAIHWSLGETFPSTLGALVAMAESVVMLDGWNDSLAVARAGEILPEHPSAVSIARAARRSVARLDGQAAAVGFLRSLADSLGADDAAAVISEVVVAHMDSLESAEAVAAAREVQARWPGSEWSRWAEGAIYEVENLLPGMPAPAFSLVDWQGEALDQEMLRDQFYMLEFFTPTHTGYQQELELRQSLLGNLDSDIFEAVSISVDPDSAYNEALLDGRPLFGRFVFEPDGLESLVATAYNVNVIPTRVLVDPSGRIVRKYAGARLQDLDRDLASILQALVQQ